MKYISMTDYTVAKHYTSSSGKIEPRDPATEWTVTKISALSAIGTLIDQSPELNWCKQNGSDRRFTLFHDRHNEKCYFIFEEETDATLFMLTWAGKTV